LRAGVSECVNPASARKPETGLRIEWALLNRIALRWIASVWVICLIVASLQPVRPPNIKEGSNFYKHQVLHVVMFGATALLFLALGRKRGDDWKAAAAVVCLAAAIELAQLLIYRMPFGYEWWDVREDTIGVAIAMLLDRRTGVRRWIISNPR
jgi:VanZ family protein